MLENIFKAAKMQSNIKFCIPRSIRKNFNLQKWAHLLKRYVEAEMQTRKPFLSTVVVKELLKETLRVLSPKPMIFWYTKEVSKEAEEEVSKEVE